MTSGMDKALEASLHEARIYGIGATSDHNQKIILEAASRFAALSPPEPTEGQVERAVDFAMSWQPSERGLSYAERRREVMDLLAPALRAMPLQDHAVTQDKRHD